ncbi:UNVERIFIED_CONTAM: hypothetical protein FKN15_015013 [Acipenser sinensis]
MVSKGRRDALKVFVALFSVSLVYSYNIDLDHPVVYQGPKGTFFGYSVLEHYHGNTRWVIVGAPKANSTFSVSVSSPGAIFKCRVHNNPEKMCTEMDMGRVVHRCQSYLIKSAKEVEDFLASQGGTGNQPPTPAAEGTKTKHLYRPVYNGDGQNSVQPSCGFC